MHRLKKLSTILAMSLAMLLVTACDNSSPDMAPDPNAQPQMGSNDAVGGNYGEPSQAAVEKAKAQLAKQNNQLAEDRAQAAIAILHPTKDNAVSGTIEFLASDLGVQVIAKVSGLAEGPHAFHVHIYGDCRAPDASSAGTHFNFQGSSLNPPAGIDRITGNLGELAADASGSATYRDTYRTVSLTGPKSIIGRAVIVHEKGNDASKPPMGATGARLACGVIGIAGPGDRADGMNMQDAKSMQ